MAEETFYTISQLAERAGVTPRTIRYYTAEGLLPRPDARSQYALYGQEHLLRLRLIARLKDAYLPLGEIKAQIEHLDIDQIRDLLEDDRAAPEPPTTTNAADYLSHLLARQQLPMAGYQRASAPDQPYPAATRPAFTVQQRVGEEEAAPPPAAAATAYGFAAPAMPPMPEHAQQPGLLRKLIPQRRARAEAEPSSAAPPSAAPESDVLPQESWRRIPLAPGVELHVRQPIAAKLEERVDALIALARNLFGGE
jgi:DNA-binding transcriptional MerR regulator